jgi:hypothetical protein
VEGTVIASIFMIVFGGVLAFSGITALCRPSDENVSLAEAIIWKTTGAEPLPKSRFFKIFERGLHVFLSLFGSVLLLVGFATLFTGI